MTREEAIKVLTLLLEVRRKYGDMQTMRNEIEAIEMAIKTLQQEPKLDWIPVSKKLPEENITVIGTTEFDDIYKTELYDDCGKKKWYANGNFDVPIVGWIPLPESYKMARWKGRNKE